MQGVVGVQRGGDGVDVLFDTSVEVRSEGGEETEGFVTGEREGEGGQGFGFRNRKGIREEK